MKLTRNQIMLIAAVAILVIVYFVFFRKKPMTEKKAVTPPAKTTDESKYSSIPGTQPFDQTFMQPTSVKAARMSMMDAINV